jgi:hypothetical protein
MKNHPSSNGAMKKEHWPLSGSPFLTKDFYSEYIWKIPTNQQSGKPRVKQVKEMKAHHKQALPKEQLLMAGKQMKMSAVALKGKRQTA